MDDTNTTVAKLKAAVEKAIEDLSKVYAKGTNLLGVPAPQVSVKWAFSTSPENDAKDTALGNAATLPTLSVYITATVTQID